VDDSLRARFNAGYSDALYRRMCALMEERLDEPEFGFRLAETPFLVPADLRAKCERGAREILAILRSDAVIAAGTISRTSSRSTSPSCETATARSRRA